MIHESYVTFEVACLLEEAGFNWSVPKLYYKYNCLTTPLVGYIGSAEDEIYGEDNNGIITYPAPTLAVAQSWLREIMEIDVLVYNCACGYIWEVSKADPESRGTGLISFDDNGEDEASGCWLSYEKALDAGLSAALKMLMTEEE